MEPILTTNSRVVLERRYLIKDDEGNVIESPEQLFHRVAKVIAAPEKRFGADDEEIARISEKFFEMMASLEFLPNSPTLMNAGRPLGQLSACFVIPIEDSMESIFDAVKSAALIHKSGGGTGFSFSRLRPTDSMVASTSGVASGPISFMKVINSATEAVKQGGTRRGANMGVLRIDHPDIEDFISCKADLSELTNFNISVCLTDEFMQAVDKGTEYSLFDPRTGDQYFKDDKPVRLDAREVFNSIVNHAWTTGEPGIIFIDKMNEGNPVSKIGLYESTNPCGEQPLLPYESCNLGSINLSRIVKAVVDSGNRSSMYSYEVDWEKLKRTVRAAVHFLDNVIEANNYPLPAIKESTQSNRKVGLGVMGWADMLFQLGIPYNSTKALELAEAIMGKIMEEGHLASQELANVRGVFPLWKDSEYNQPGYDPIKMRNSTVTTIAPTGTISIIAGASSGIEPIFALAYTRNVMDNTRLTEINPILEEKAKERGFYSEDFIEKLAKTGSLQDLEEVPDDIKEIFVTSHDISPEWHIRMQAAFQKHTDNAVSKTINLPSEATREDVASAYRLAYKLNCKGVTVYRDGCRSNQVLCIKKEKESKEAEESARLIKRRPSVLTGITEKIKTGYGNLYVTINSVNDNPFEVFAQIGKSGHSTMADTEAVCRLISLALRSGIDIHDITDQLTGIGGASQVFQNGGLVKSMPDAIAKVLHTHFGNGHKRKRDNDMEHEFCPECDGSLEHSSGCIVCPSCGFSQC
ncbi:MAG: vitamin B12-dependent ribonucleotide reductase [candidate division Zixibacteria bacterium]|nr:vitamin B12-dependent ribonucleotide reductase [candidate division Zixibacteria bacterium]